MASYAKHRGLAAPLLGVNLVLYIILLGLASWALDEQLDGHLAGGNQATSDLIRFSLIAGVVGIASVLVGLFHLKHRRSESHGGAGSAAVIALLLTLLAFGVACKQVHVGYIYSDRLKALEAFAIVVAATQLLYVLLMYFADE
ncbi:hypothetical protein SELMODRAFT_439591 [Selaginella moellendorffii]|uniref:DUF4149 domain-containing protein n=1 Tax=Selaginella moellendorffii TaxID=88036 RepID=D8R684_SELML|nr:membrane protein PM19L [Selaginella moellendorffii]EFJ32624.1 hypothetical protein SELMODRAFT_439591 [Selaginella moellendorffii]|eukprot:XP_002966597.1 membrane protein PM19L [Selaginella moellendorffii]